MLVAVVAAVIGGLFVVGLNALVFSHHFGKLEGTVQAKHEDHERRIGILETKVFDL